MRVYGYVRVSQVRGRKGASFISPTVQRDHIDRWAQAEGAEIVGILEELDVSGSRRDRPKLTRIVEAIETGEVDGMVVAKLDRYFRDQLGGHELMARIKDARGFLAIPGDGIDTRHDAGKMMFGFLLTIAEGELDRYRRQFADARARAVARGIHPCPVPPLGYQRRGDGGLEPRPRVGPVVRELFAKRASGEPLAQLARWLESRTIHSAYGSPAWTGRAVKNIVRNRVYLGEAHHGEYVNPTAHDPLTDPVTWRRAQHPGRVAGQRGENPALLSGLLRCAGCRYGMRSWITRQGSRAYGCHRRHAGGVCPEPAGTSSPELERIVVERFFEKIGDVSMEPAHSTAELEKATERLAQAEGDLAQYRDDPTILRAAGAEHFAAGLESRLATIRDAERQVDDTTPRASTGLDAEALRAAWPELTTLERKRLMRTVIDAVFLRRGRGIPMTDRVRVCFRGQAPELPGPGMRPSPAPTPFDF